MNKLCCKTGRPRRNEKGNIFRTIQSSKTEPEENRKLEQTTYIEGFT